MDATIESKIWVIVEQRRGRLTEVGLEIVGRAIDLAGPVGWKVAAVILGHGLEETAREVLAYGVDEVLALDHPLLTDYCNQAYVAALEAPIRSARPEVILLGATARGTDLGPRLAARLRTGLSAHCVDLELTPGGGLLAVVPGWGGTVMARISCPRACPQMATVMPGVFPMPSPSESRGRVLVTQPDLSPADVTYRVVEVETGPPEPSDLEAARVVVAGGWGVGGPDGWRLVEELADALHGAVGATRPAVDESWADEGQMIGTSGRR
ncbi:MAG: electron transfer flavoprotein subunit alpha/FixB family protein, partial [Proteobacteria bacterium]|nr:electron transfer flavoprotein subunit alpha/FixB family protein [Pseudomonadota bacterium]